MTSDGRLCLGQSVSLSTVMFVGVIKAQDTNAPYREGAERRSYTDHQRPTCSGPFAFDSVACDVLDVASFRRLAISPLNRVPACVLSYAFILRWCDAIARNQNAVLFVCLLLTVVVVVRLRRSSPVIPSAAVC